MHEPHFSLREGQEHPPVIKLMAVITGQDKAATVATMLQEAHFPFTYQLRAEGTAPSEMLDVFGLADTERCVTLLLTPDMAVEHILDQFKRRLGLASPGQGIAFTIPLSGVGLQLARHLDTEAHKKFHERMVKEVERMKTEAGHTLVLSIIEQGHSERLMEAAKQAGATGGTALHCHRIASGEMMKFWGITVQNEKEIVAILVPQKQKMALMKALSAACGPMTSAHGMILSLPVDAVEGLPLPEDEE